MKRVFTILLFLSMVGYAYAECLVQDLIDLKITNINNPYIEMQNYLYNNKEEIKTCTAEQLSTELNNMYSKYTKSYDGCVIFGREVLFSMLTSVNKENMYTKYMDSTKDNNTILSVQDTKFIDIATKTFEDWSSHACKTGESTSSYLDMVDSIVNTVNKDIK